MKKMICLALIFALALTGCGSKNAPETQPPTQSIPGTEAPETVPATEAPTEAAAYESGETVLVDNEFVTFTVTGFRENAHLGLEMQVFCENKTDRTVMFSLDGVSVCGVMHDPFWAEEVAPGKKANSTVSFDTFTLAEQGIESVDEISFRLSATDSDSWLDEPFADDHFTVYPTGLNADTVVFPEYRHKNGETVVLDNENLLFIVEKVDDTDTGFYTLNCYLANRTDKDLMVSWDGVSVNGFMVDPFWAAAVSAGKQMYTSIRFASADLAEQGIDTVTELAFTLTAYDYNSFDMDYVVEENLTFLPK